MISLDDANYEPKSRISESTKSVERSMRLASLLQNFTAYWRKQLQKTMSQDFKQAEDLYSEREVISLLYNNLNIKSL